MKVTQTLRMNYEFSRVYHKGRFSAGRYVVLHYLNRNSRMNRLGVTASRRMKGSVRRNRIKRLLRESYRLLEDKIAVGYDLVLVGRETDPEPDFHTVSQEIDRLFQRSGLIKADLKAKEIEPPEGETGE